MFKLKKLNEAVQDPQRVPTPTVPAKPQQGAGQVKKMSTDTEEEPSISPEEVELVRTKVKVFFDQLKNNQKLMSLLNFTSPIEKREAIIQFAKRVGIPAGQIPALITGIRSAQDQESSKVPAQESVKKKR